MARVAMLVSNPCNADARVIKMARAAALGGHDVHVFATSGRETVLFERVDGVTYHRFDWHPGQMIASVPPLSWIGRLSRKTMLFMVKRIIPYFKYRLFANVFSEDVAKLRPDIIHAHDLICLPAAHRAADQCSAKVIYDAHELEMHRNPPLPFMQKRWVSYIERKFARRSVAVITVGTMVSQELSKHLKRPHITVIYNSPMIQDCPRNIRTDLNISPDVPLLIYVGKVTTGRGVGEILALLPKLKGVVFATVGPCDNQTRLILQRQAEKTEVAGNFRILPSVPFEQVVSYIRGAGLGIISVEPITLSYRYCMPNKLFELSFANVPIISNKLDDIENFLTQFGNGEIADFRNTATLPHMIFRMLKEKRQYLMTADTLSLLHDQYSWESQSKLLLSIYQKA
jgi:glycosyltransferase involved in cell wall biosynthesis